MGCLQGQKNDSDESCSCDTEGSESKARWMRVWEVKRVWGRCGLRDAGKDGLSQVKVYIVSVKISTLLSSTDEGGRKVRIWP